MSSSAVKVSRVFSGDPRGDFHISGAWVAVTEQKSGHLTWPRRHRLDVTAVELANIAGVEANTVRKIAAELLSMLERDMQESKPNIGETETA
jgi:hypothetical protein